MKAIIECPKTVCIDDIEPGDIIAFRIGQDVFQLVSIEGGQWFFACLTHPKVHWNLEPDPRTAARRRVRMNGVTLYQFEDLFDFSSWLRAQSHDILKENGRRRDEDGSRNKEQD